MSRQPIGKDYRKLEREQAKERRRAERQQRRQERQAAKARAVCEPAQQVGEGIISA